MLLSGGGVVTVMREECSPCQSLKASEVKCQSPDFVKGPEITAFPSHTGQISITCQTPCKAKRNTAE